MPAAVPLFGIVVDAGSSGTRARIFRSQPGANNLPSFVEVVPSAGTLRATPGLSSFVHAPKRASEQVLGLVDAARRWVPAERHASTPLWVKGTAGLRQLPAARAEAVLAAVRAALADRARCPFAFAEARIITGDEEALFGWLAINQLLGLLPRPLSTATQVGWLDLGGASAQIAHGMPEASAAGDWQSARALALPHGQARVFLRSFSKFGRAEAFWRSCRLLAAAQNLSAHERLAADAAPAPRTRLAHPCLAVGDEYTPDHARDLVYVGTGNAGGCEALVGRLNHADEECPPGFCGRLAVPFSGQFYGAGNYWYTASHLGIASDDGARVLSGSDYRAAAREACARPWSWHKNQFAGAEWAYVRFDCFSGLYIASLLEHKHGIAPSARVVTIARHLNGSLVDWTSGSLLYEVALRPQGPVPPWGGDTD